MPTPGSIPQDPCIMGREQLNVEVHFSADRKKQARFGTHEELEHALSGSGLSLTDLNQVDFLCNTLARATSAVMLTSHCGLDRSLATLTLCADAALRTQTRSESKVGPPGSSPVVESKVRATEGPVINPSVLVLVSSEYQSDQAFKAVRDFIACGGLPLVAGDYSFEARFPTAWQPDVADIAICETERAATMLRFGTLRLAKLQLVICDEAHEMLGPKTEDVYPEYPPADAIYRVMSRIRARNNSACMVWTSSARHAASLAVISKLVLHPNAGQNSVDIDVPALYGVKPSEAQVSSSTQITSDLKGYVNLASPAVTATNIAKAKALDVDTKPLCRLNKPISELDTLTNMFSQVAVVEHNQPFALKPLTLHIAPFEGRKILIFEESKSKTTFLSLPAELRNRIYDLALPKGNIYDFDVFQPPDLKKSCRAVRPSFMRECDRSNRAFNHARSKWAVMPFTDTFALPKVSRQVTEETLPMIYGHSAFEFENVQLMSVFLHGIGSMRQYVRTIYITSLPSYQMRKRKKPFKPLLSVPNLQNLFLSADYSGRPRDWLRAFPDAAKSFLRSWQDANKDKDGSPHGLELLKVTRKCPGCERQTNATQSQCECGADLERLPSRWKEGMGTHREDIERIQNELRDSIAKQLDLKSETKRE